MIRVIVNGALGRMGSQVRALVEQTDGFILAAAVDQRAGDGGYSHLAQVREEADVLVDFSHHGAVEEVAEFLLRRGMPGVLCTTGYDRDELDVIATAATAAPLFWTANTSVGVALLAQMARQAAAVFPQADISIIECHHTGKLDAPSGTALILAQAIRTGHETRAVDMHSMRMGDVVGDHQVIINAGAQTITLRHEAHDRVIFAQGALAAAEFMVGKSKGLYGMEELLHVGEAAR